MARTEWMARTVADVVGMGGSVELDEELVARAQVADWLDAEYALDEDDEAWVIDAVTGPEIAYEDREILLGGYGIAVQYNA